MYNKDNKSLQIIQTSNIVLLRYSLINVILDFFVIIHVKFLFLEQQRENDRALRKAGRDIERDRREMEREEKKLVNIT